MKKGRKLSLGIETYQMAAKQTRIDRQVCHLNKYEHSTFPDPRTLALIKMLKSEKNKDPRNQDPEENLKRNP